MLPNQLIPESQKILQIYSMFETRLEAGEEQIQTQGQSFRIFTNSANLSLRVDLAVLIPVQPGKRPVLLGRCRVVKKSRTSLASSSAVISSPIILRAGKEILCLSRILFGAVFNRL